ncbi:hypothetical protein PR001_g2519 [Phytophthora rubi]|uniref:Reverse transcriptase domain-containing protein n=1 Tax=Phytophthora rubi TaxID=129364 RepID=A0A6A3PCD9_9STRA|nr:hypothetical protein PR001_g2519 [Phytophthora rubi]
MLRRGVPEATTSWSHQASADPPPAPGRASRPSRPPRQAGCLVYKGPHWLKDCPATTEAQKADARERFREAKERRSNTIRSKAARYDSPAGSVRINGLVEAPYIPDTGADKSIIPQGIVDSLLAVLPTLTHTPLSTRVDVEMADGRRLVCEHEVLLNLELVTSAGPVSIRSVPGLILAGEGEEFLLGRDALKELGIDIDHQLAQQAGQPLLGADEDEFPVGDGLPNEQDAHDPRQAIDRLVAQVVSEGLPANHVETVRSVLTTYPDIWSEAIGPDPPAHVEPLRVTLQDLAVPYRSPPHKYAPLQADFVREYVRTLVANGFVVKNNASRWASAAVPVRKPGSRDKFRMTIDYRPVTRVTIPIAGSMLTNATTTDAFAGKKVFGSFDFTQGFWQLPLHEASREILFSFITEDGVFTPNRVPQEATDSALHFQGEMQRLLAPLIPHSALVWVDDVILFAPTVSEFVEVLGDFFSLVAAAKLKLNVLKCSLFKMEVLWCGRLISGAGIRHDPDRVGALSTLPLPATIADLRYFVCATNWLQDSLSDYARMIAPLQEKLAAEKKRVGGRVERRYGVGGARTSCLRGDVLACPRLGPHGVA